MKQLGLEEWFAAAVITLNHNARTLVTKSDWGSETDNVIIGMYYGTAQSQLWFITMMEAVTKNVRGLP